MRASASLLLPALLAGCAAGTNVPSLAPRPAETIDPRLEVEDRSAQIPADPALAQRLSALVAQAQAAVGTFSSAIAAAERLAAGAGSPQSESWIAAQQALSGAVAARQPVTRALADVDALASERIVTQGGLAPANQALVREAAQAIGTIDRVQALRVDAVQARLRG